MEVHVEDGEECPNRGCRMHVRHPCELCGRTAARGKTTVRWGALVVRNEKSVDGRIYRKWERGRL